MVMSELEICAGNKDTSSQVRRTNLNDVRILMSKTWSRMTNRLTMDTLRPLPMFLGIDNQVFCTAPGAFVVSSDVKTIQRRMALNFAFFLTNYALVAFGVTVVVSLLHPGMMIVCGTVFMLWKAHDWLIRNQIQLAGTNIGKLLTIQQRSSILTILTAIAIVWKCLFPFFLSFTVSGGLILAHAVARDPRTIEDDKSFNIMDEDEVLVERGDVI